MNEDVNVIIDEIKEDIAKFEEATQPKIPTVEGGIEVVSGTGALQGSFATREEAEAFAKLTGFVIKEEVAPVVETPVEVPVEVAPVETPVESAETPVTE